MASPADSRPTDERPSKGYFLPYQERWLADQARFKIVEKSRRIGMTYVQSYEDVRDAAREKGMDVFFSSADESAAAEYIRYCKMWAEMYDTAARYLGEVVINKRDDVKALCIQFSSGFRTYALSSNPKAFRSKGGKIVLDEYGHHPNQEELRKAAGPAMLWGFPMRILSTHNGKGCAYWRAVDEARRGNGWSLHTITIEDALAAGLLDKILKHPATAEDKAAFLADCRRMAGSEEAFQEEFMCIPRDELSAWMAWDLITGGEHKDAGRPELYGGGPAYVGFDVARRRDLAVIWVDELVGDIAWTRQVIEMKRTEFEEMYRQFDGVMERFNVRRACIDQGGMGEPVVERMQKKWGAYRVEGVLFNPTVKQDMAVKVKQAYEDKRVRVPGTRIIRESHHAVRQEVTSAGNLRFVADHDAEIGHGDHFWSHGLCLLARDGSPRGGPVDYTPAQPRRFSSLKGAW